MYQDYKTFNSYSYSKDLDGCLKSHMTYSCSYYHKVFLKLRNKHAPIKKKILLLNNNLFKALRKVIMQRPKLRKIYSK